MRRGPDFGLRVCGRMRPPERAKRISLKGPARVAFALLRVLLAVGIVAWVVHSVGIELIFAELRQVRLSHLVLIIVWFIVEGLLKVLNWRQMLGAMLGNPRLDFGRLLNANLTGAFLGAVIPSSAGTDAIRAVYSRAYFGGHLAAHAASVVTLNAFNWFAGSVLGLAIGIVLFARGMLPLALGFVLLILAGVVVAAPSVYLLLKLRRSWLVLGLRRMRARWFKLRHALRRFFDALLIFEHAHASLTRIALVGALAVVAQGLVWMFAGRGLGVDLPLHFWILMVPITGLANVVPLSIAGFGFNQAAHVAVLAAFGVDPATGVAISALVMFSGTVYNVVLGGAAFALSGKLSK
jgi:glycosyltransferase 2 family protein